MKKEIKKGGAWPELACSPPDANTTNIKIGRNDAKRTRQLNPGHMVPHHRRHDKKKEAKKMTSHAIGFDLNEGGGVICCFCFKDILKKHEMPDLLVAITRPSKILKGTALCPKCNLPYLRGQTLEAAEYITKKWL